MQKNTITSRLEIRELVSTDENFIFELVNTPEWIEYIGDRKIINHDDAVGYVRKIMEDKNIRYWVVTLKNSAIPMGIVTLIKRPYLSHHDIGFAFLREFCGNGYAFEATRAILTECSRQGIHSKILATSVPGNTKSIRLLEKMGFHFDSELMITTETLVLYSISNEKLQISDIVNRFYGIFINENVGSPNWDTINEVCIPKALIIKKHGQEEEVYNLTTFIEPRKKLLSDGTLTGFSESEISGETKISGHIAQHFSNYRKHGTMNGQYFESYGNKLFQLVNTKDGWKISAVLWEDL